MNKVVKTICALFFLSVHCFGASSGSSSVIASVDFRDYTLTVSSEYGSPIPSVGEHVYAWKSTVTCMVESAVSSDGTNYACIGWAGDGIDPKTNSTASSGTLVLTTLNSYIEWVWQESETYYVNASRPNDLGDGLSWATAKKTIQAAVDLAIDGDTVLVTNGVYDAGGALAPVYVDAYGYSYTNSLPNRVCITKTVTVRSVNGPETTIIQGASDNGTNGPAAVRCAYLYSGAIMDGFTLANGHTFFESGEESDIFGGGAYMLINSTLNNCIVERNSASFGGGGAYCREGGTLNNCVLSENSAWGGGGGAFLEGNDDGATLNNCLLTGNFAGRGGGISIIGIGTLNNCTLVGNYGGGINEMPWGGTLNNCIVWGNTEDGFNNIEGHGLTIHHTCSSPLPDGEGNICADPMFVDSVHSNFQLQASSPCINAGQNSYVTGINDLDDSSRIIGGVVDMGAYETQAAGTDADNDGMDDRWELDQFGGRHFADPSTICSNGVSTLYEAYVAGIDPKNSSSRFDVMMLPGPSLQWTSVSGRVYSVYYSTNLLEGFSPLQTNIPWTVGSFTGDVHNAGSQMYYKIGVELAP